ncbi:hypothetical protein NL50_05325 [Clostridium acetobutylicum]|nr:hypothetical protein NL50_05325 [Clostridium acetobutylicum]
MAGLSKINNASSRGEAISKKISFDVGDTFSARVISEKDGGNEVTLKTSDGWSFNAKVENPADINDGQASKFVVTGVEDGKIKLKFVQNENIDQSTANGKNILGELVNELGLSKSDVDENVLKLMLKYNMPLTKENIAKMETILDFNDKLSNEADKSDEFIMKYLQNRSIAPDSEEGVNIINTLKGLSENLKGMSSEDMFTLIENNIDITPNNVESYKKLFKGETSIYNELKNIEESLSDGNSASFIKESVKDYIKDLSNINIKEAIQQHNEEVISSTSKQASQESNINKLQDNLKLLDSMKEILSKNYLTEVVVDGKKVNIANIIKDYVSENWQDITKFSKDQLLGNMMNKILSETGMNKEQLAAVFKELINNSDMTETEVNNLLKNLEPKDSENLASTAFKAEEETLLNKVDANKGQILKNDNMPQTQPKTTAENVKQEINLKINNMKDIVGKLLSESNNGNANMQDTIAALIKNNINDFKVFNSVSNEYYYMDVPIRNNNDDYQCKLIIKDDRKSGKRVDSKNVKIVTSVKTVNMGEVDAYITVLNNSMSINVKCDKDWVKILDKAKANAVKKISDMGYNINMTVEKKKEDKEIDIVECREFFNDKEYFKLDTRV